MAHQKVASLLLLLLGRTAIALPYSQQQLAAQTNLKRIQAIARDEKLALLEYTTKPTLRKEHTNQHSGQLAKGDTYDASLFSAEHAAFKAAHNAVFATVSARLARRESDCVFFLDGRDAATTRALLDPAPRPFAAAQLLAANRHADTCTAIRAEGPEVVHASARRALSGAFADRDIVGYYLDACSGAVSPLVETLDAALAPRPSVAPPDKVVLGFTLTNACKSGENLHDREQRVVCAVRSLGERVGYARMCRVADDPGVWGLTEPIWRFAASSCRRE